MKLVDRQVTYELIGPFLFGAAAFSSVFFAGAVLPQLTEWLTKGMPVLTAIEIMILSLPSIVFYTLPMATLLAVLMGVGRLSGESEVTALFAGGVSFYRISVPILILGVGVSGFSIALNEIVAPVANSRATALKAAVLNTVSPSEQPFTLEDPRTNSRIIIKGGMNVDKGILRDITIVQFVKNQPALIIFAHRAEWTGMNDESKRYRWKLHDGYVQDLTDTTRLTSVAFNNTQTREVDIFKTPSELSMYQNLKPEQMSFTQLSKMISDIKTYPDRPIDQIRRLDADRWNKLAVPLTSLVFALLAAPMGIRPSRSSSSVGLGLSILVIFLYWILGRYTYTLAAQGTLAPMVGAFAPLAFGIVAAVILLKRAAK